MAPRRAKRRVIGAPHSGCGHRGARVSPRSVTRTRECGGARAGQIADVFPSRGHGRWESPKPSPNGPDRATSRMAHAVEPSGPDDDAKTGAGSPRLEIIRPVEVDDRPAPEQEPVGVAEAQAALAGQPVERGCLLDRDVAPVVGILRADRGVRRPVTQFGARLPPPESGTQLGFVRGHGLVSYRTRQEHRADVRDVGRLLRRQRAGALGRSR